MCPYCRTNAPLVYRGLKATCSACGRSRTILSGSSLTHAGKTSKVGGSVVQALGYFTLVIGLFFSAVFGLLVSLFTTTGGLAVGGIFSLITLVTFLILRSGGKKLEASGYEAQDARREQALFAMAQNRGGVLQAHEAAAALDMPLDQADAFLTRMAKQRPDVVGVDIGEEGEIFYTFPQFARGAGAGGMFNGWSAAAEQRVRVDAEPRVEVSAPQPRAPSAEAKVIDADFEAIAEDEAGRTKQTRARRPE